MSRGALLTGTAGGIIGTITSALGFIWYIVYLYIAQRYTWILFVPVYTGPSTLVIAFTILFLALLLVSCVLTGVGFYGLYAIGGSSMGIVALIFGIIGGASFLVLELIDLFTNNPILFLIGVIILIISFIIIGAASITLREVTTRPGAALAAGILSIIGGVLLIGLLGFPLLFVAFLLWAIVFHTTEA
nr:hypothetical protein [Candidatus Freyarchaeota archaeon]